MPSIYFAPALYFCNPSNPLPQVRDLIHPNVFFFFQGSHANKMHRAFCFLSPTHCPAFRSTHTQRWFFQPLSPIATPLCSIRVAALPLPNHPLTDLCCKYRYASVFAPTDIYFAPLFQLPTTGLGCRRPSCSIAHATHLLCEILPNFYLILFCMYFTCSLPLCI